MRPADDAARELEVLGLSRAEADAYELLVDRLPSTVGQLSDDWVEPADLRSTLDDLGAKGLVRRSGSGDPTYAAVPPETALRNLLLLAEQRLCTARQSIDRVLAVYRDQLARTGSDSIVEVVTDGPAIRQRLQSLRYGAWSEIRCLGDSLPPVAAETPKRRIIYHGTEIDAQGNFEQVRLLPALPVNLMMYDDRLAILPLRHEEGIVVVHPSTLLDALGDLFEQLWQRAVAVEVPASGIRRTPGRQGGVDDERLIALLLAGLTDQAIARQLGVSQRTAHRRIGSLIDRLGVETRFQAGVRAALRVRNPDRPGLWTAT
ncbi:helix-turn-helix transcriptional regulator [Kribbella sp. NPDC051952]|uniref:helix-turn-helix transcriptional regulator n=1 Tax=Kribbella sp. NPDC051952 TaxID=3154851 RepID=UPI003441AAF8